MGVVWSSQRPRPARENNSSSYLFHEACAVRPLLRRRHETKAGNVPIDTSGVCISWERFRGLRFWRAPRRSIENRQETVRTPARRSPATSLHNRSPRLGCGRRSVPCARGICRESRMLRIPGGLGKPESDRSKALTSAVRLVSRAQPCRPRNSRRWSSPSPRSTSSTRNFEERSCCCADGNKKLRNSGRR